MSTYAQGIRKDPLFLRNQFVSEGCFDMPIIKRQEITWQGVTAIGFHNAKANDMHASQRAVHCFKDDYRINQAYDRPKAAFKKVANYACLMTPNYSFFSNMPKPLQMYSVFRSRWVGAYWQSLGKQVVPNVSWGLPDSYDFCFDGIQVGSVVVVSTMGAKRTKEGFLSGYQEMLRVLSPAEVWCYCSPFSEMMSSVSRVLPYEAERKEIFNAVHPAQLSLFDESGEKKTA